jgi:hypothetical protein
MDRIRSAGGGLLMAEAAAGCPPPVPGFPLGTLVVNEGPKRPLKTGSNSPGQAQSLMPTFAGNKGTWGVSDH